MAEAEAAADGWQYHPRNEKRPGEGGEEGGASGKRPKRDGDEGHHNNELGCPPCEGIDGEEVARLLAARKDSSGRKLKLTPQHLYVAYVWYLNQREWKQREGGREFGAGEEEHFCFKCKDGGEMLLCDFDSPQCCKSYHTRCCNLKKAPEGVWECPRHRCVQCGVGPSATDAYGRPRRPSSGATSGCGRAARARRPSVATVCPTASSTSRTRSSAAAASCSSTPISSSSSAISRVGTPTSSSPPPMAGAAAGAAVAAVAVAAAVALGLAAVVQVMM